MKSVVQRACAALLAAITICVMVVIGAPEIHAATDPTNVQGTIAPGGSTVALTWDAPTTTQFDFPVSFLGTTYNQMYVSSDSAITFGGGIDDLQLNYGVLQTTLPAVMICASDVLYQQVYYRIDTSVTPNELHVRYEGSATRNAALGNPNIEWEATFYRDQSYFDLLIGQDAACARPNDLTNIQNSGTVLASPAFAPSTNWRISTSSGNLATVTANGNTASWAFSSSGTAASADMVAAGYRKVVSGSIESGSVKIPYPPTGYSVQQTTDGGTTWTSIYTSSTLTTGFTTGTLTYGTSYKFRVASYFASPAEAGTYSSPSPTFTPYGFASAPALSSTQPGNSQISFTFYKSSSDGGTPITAYTVQHSDDNGVTWVTDTASITPAQPTMTYVVTGLTNGTAYKLRAAAITAYSAGYWSSIDTATPRTVPDAPTNVAGTATGAGQVTLTWTAPAWNGGAAITNYYVQYSTDGGTTWSSAASTGSTTTSSVRTALAAGSYVFRVAGYHTAGTGAYSSASASVVVYTSPGNVTSLTATPGVKQVALSWSAPTTLNNSTVTGYTIQQWTTGGYVTVVADTGLVTSYTFTNLAAAVAVRYSVAALSTGGTGAYTVTANVTPYDLPAAPTFSTVTAGNTSAAIALTAPSNNGSTITSYLFQYSSDGGTTWSASLSNATVSYSVTGLTAKTSYVFRAAAVNAAGTGPWSANSSVVTPYGVSSAPLNIVATAGLGSVTVTWDTPLDDGGSALTSYQLQYSTNGGTGWTVISGISTSTTTYTKTGLTAGTNHIFRVYAVNAAGSTSSAITPNVMPYGIPAAPTGLVTTAGEKQITLSWTAPSSNGSAITNYYYQYSTDGGTNWSTAISTGVTASPYIVTALNAGTSYTFKVAAYNVAGTGPYSATATTIPYELPSEPQNFTVTAGDASVVLNWTAPATLGYPAISGFRYQISSDNGATWGAAVAFGGTSATLTKTLTALVNGTSYKFRIAAYNSSGTGTYTADSGTVKPRGLTVAPTALAGTRGLGQVTLTWTAPSANGGTISDYSYQYSSNAGGTWSTAALTGSSSASYTVTGLTNGMSYIFKVAAVNEAGTGTYSANSAAVIPAGVPASIASITTTPGNNQMFLSWTAPANNGFAITDYVIRYSSDSEATWTTFADGTSVIASTTVTGLVNGTNYTFQVAAANSIGTGTWSASSSVVYPYTLPGVPTGISVSNGAGGPTISWTAPAANGSAISGYAVQYSSNSGTTWSTATSSTGSAATSYQATTVSMGGSYIFRVAAVNLAGTGTYSSNTTSVTAYNLPGAPTGVTATAGILKVTLSWTAPAANGSAITNYYYQYSTDGGTNWSSAIGTGSTTTSYVVNSLAADTTYRFKVAAYNVGGTGDYSAVTSAATVYDFPSVPTSLAATAGDQQVALTWTAPAANGSPITSYYVQKSTNGGTTWGTAVSTGSSSASYTMTGLVNGVSYLFKVAAANAAGTGTYTAATTTQVPYGLTAAPTALTAVRGNTQVVLTWTAPANNGAAISDYYYQSSTDNGTTWSSGVAIGSTSATHTVTGLTNGTSYVFRVAAYNPAGLGAYSAASTAAVPATLPGAISSVSPTAGNTQAVLTWSEPASNGSIITDYVVRFSGDGESTWTTFSDGVSSSTGATVTGLTNGTSYTFQVAAVNAVGTASWSTSSASIIPYTFAGTPTNLTASAGVLNVALSWTAPANNGSAITNYYYQISDDGGATWSSGQSVGGSVTSYTVANLTATTSYMFRVAAKNTAGVGTYSSDTSAVTVYNYPGIPTALASTAGILQASLSWNAPASNGSAISTYYYKYSTNGGSTWSSEISNGSTNTAITLNNLTANTAYTFKVAAYNAAGIGAYTSSTAAVTVYDVPSAPTALTAIAGDHKVNLAWTAPSGNGAAISEYSVQMSSDGGTSWNTAVLTSSTATSYEYAGLTNGTSYKFRVAAINIAGAGANSAASSTAIPYGYTTAPTSLTATRGNAQVALTWNAATGNGSAVSDYYYQYSTDAGNSWSTATAIGSTNTSYTVTGLTNGTSYKFRVAGYNAAGVGAYSTESTAVVPATLPGTIATVDMSPGDTQVILQWFAPASNGEAITDYTIQYSSNSGVSWTTFNDGVGSTTDATVTGLTNGVSYIFKVAAINAVGTGSTITSSSIIPRTTATAPRSLAGSTGNAQISLSWTAPISNGGFPITDYEVQSSADYGATWVSFAHTATSVPAAIVSSLTNGTSYVFRVAAKTSIGTGAWSSTSSAVVPFTTPNAPTALSGTPENAQVSLSWTAPVVDGGNAISDYTVEYSLDSGTTWITFTDAVSTLTAGTVTGLTNGTNYKFRVSAVNDAGTGATTAATASIVPRTVPTMVQNLAGTAGNGQMSLSWTAPASNNGAAITDYTVQYSSNAGTSWSTFTRSVSTATSATVTGLNNGSGYTFRVAAVNIAGTGTWSLVTDSITPYTASDAPTSAAVTGGNAQATISWVAPVWNGGAALFDYEVQYSSNGGTSWTTWTHMASTSTSATVTGLTNGISYVFRVAAVNAAGNGTYTAATSAITPITSATAPTLVSGVPGNTQVVVSWTAPSSNGGSTITDYLVSLSTDSGTTWGSGVSVGSAAVSFTYTGLTNGTSYVFRIAAVNGAGIGTWSDASSVVVPRTISNAPSNVSGTPGNTQVSLVWNAPVSNGGSAITDYVVDYSSNNGSTWTTFSDGTSPNRATAVTGLTNGTDYVFRVAAVNIAGTSTWSSTSSSVAPRTIPAAPTITGITIGNATLSVAFTAGDSGGTTITGYEYSTDNGATWRTRVLGSTESPLVISTLSSDGTSSLANGVTYQVKIRAVNIAGVGSSSTNFDATPLTIPTAPLAVTATPAVASAVVSWNSPTFNGGTTITDFVIEYSSDAGSTWSTFTHSVSSQRNATVTGLSNGTAYVFRIAAVNSVGTGPVSASSTSVTPRTVPDAPSGLVVTPGNSTIVVDWAAPNSGGSPITDYVVEYSTNSGTSWSTYNDGVSTSASATLSGLLNGTSYLIRVSATNIAGTSAVTVASAAVTPRTVPNAPTLGVPTPGNLSISVPFTLNYNGGSTVTSIDYSIDNGATWTTGASTTSPLSITGLTNGTAYSVRIRAVNVAGAGTESASVISTPRTPPSAPSITSVTPVNAGATVAFTLSNNGGSAVTDYQYSTNGGTSWQSAGVTVSPISISGLTNGTSYNLKIRAVNIAGTGAASSQSSVVPYTTPGAPTITQVDGGNGTVTINLAAGATGGSAITNYEYSLDNGASWVTRTPASTGSTITVTGLADGTQYSVRVRAVNIAGSGTASDVYYVSTNGVPEAPTISSATPSYNSVTLLISPAGNGGDPIINYQYSLNGGITWTTRSPASVNQSLYIGGLTNGTTYQVAVRAVNAVGAGDVSSVVTVKTHTVPLAPVVNTEVVSGNRQLTITFTPSGDGGEAITAYDYSTDRGITWNRRTDGGGTTSPMVITVLSTNGATQLTNGFMYDVQIRAINVVGTSDASNDVSGTPYTVPSPPSIGVVTAGDTSATVSFLPGTNGGSVITGYEYSTDSGTTWVAAPTIFSPLRITNQSTSGTPVLVNGATYQLKMRAINASGYSTATAAVSFMPRTTPDQPTVTGVTATSAQISVAFTAGGNGGAAISSYEYSTDGGVTWRTRTPGASLVSSPIVITTQSFDGLTPLENGTSYDVLIRAVNVAGFGVESVTYSRIPSGTPDVPVINSISGEDTRIVIAFTAGHSNGSAVTSNEYSTDGGAHWTAAGSLTSPLTVTGLINGTTYAVQLRHVNANGAGVATSSTSGKPKKRPDAPTITASTVGNGTITVTFTTGADGGDAISMYQYSTDNGTTWRARSFGTIETALGISTASVDGITQLANGSPYMVKVRAVNSAGNGVASDAVRLIPYTVPATPVVGTLTTGDSGAEVAYTIANDGGSALTSIDYSLDGGVTWIATHAVENPLRVSGLSNGTSYSLVLRAVNIAGSSVGSSTSVVSPSGIPGVPRIDTVVPGNASMTFNFTPGSASGSAITGYEYSLDGGVTWATATITLPATKFVVTGLTNGTVYSTRIRAVNANGPGTASDTAILKPYTVPSPPTNTSATMGANSITLTYAAPTTDGGQPITSYQYSLDGGATWVTAPATGPSSFVISNLANASAYTVAVRAVSAAGTGDIVSVQAVTPVVAVPATVAPETTPVVTPATVPVNPATTVTTTTKKKASTKKKSPTKKTTSTSATSKKPKSSQSSSGTATTVAPTTSVPPTSTTSVAPHLPSKTSTSHQSTISLKQMLAIITATLSLLWVVVLFVRRRKTRQS